MGIRKFVRENREMIDAVIRKNGGRIFNDEEREAWIMNNESLYIMARCSGVNV